MPDRDALVEKVARTICESEADYPIGYFPDGSPMRAGGHWDEYMDSQHEEWRRYARAAIASILPPTTSAGDGELDICPACDGSGEGVADTVCKRCDGSGGVPLGGEVTRGSERADRQSQPLANEGCNSPPLRPSLIELVDHVANGGPHEWGYRDLTDGTFIEDDWPFKAAEALPRLTARVKELEEAQAAHLNDIAMMMSEFVDNWPQPKKASTALKLIAKTLRASLDERNAATARVKELESSRASLASIIDGLTDELERQRRINRETDPSID